MCLGKRGRRKEEEGKLKKDSGASAVGPSQQHTPPLLSNITSLPPSSHHALSSTNTPGAAVYLKLLQDRTFTRSK
jgi:hypothetical protein